MHERVTFRSWDKHGIVDLAKNAVEKGGYTMLTHLFNAMPSFHHHDPGLWDFWDVQMYVDFDLSFTYTTRTLRILEYQQVRDKFCLHCGWNTLTSLLMCDCQCVSSNGLILVTDAMAAMGLEDGEHQLGEMRVKVKGNRAVISGHRFLPVASAPCTCVRLVVIGCSRVGIEAASLHPAQLLGIEDKRDTKARCGW